MNRLAVLAALAVAITVCDGIKCRCNNKFRRTQGQVSGGLLNAITTCDEMNTCEVKEETCAGDSDCSLMLDYARQQAPERPLRPSCYHDVGQGIQGCQWWSGGHECDRTLFIPNQNAYRCMSGDFCNDLTAEQVNEVCNE